MAMKPEDQKKRTGASAASAATQNPSGVQLVSNPNDQDAVERIIAKSYYSTVFEQSADEVWAVVRDFNDYPRYIDGVDESHIEDDKPGDAIEAVRCFRYHGEWIRQRLVAHSDADRSFTYAGLEPFHFPPLDPDEKAPPLSPVTYEGTLRVTPIVDGNRSLIEWRLTFACVPGECERWEAFLAEVIPQWVGSLRSSRSVRRRSPLDR